MASTRLNPERIAAVLFTAELVGDLAAAKKWGVSRSTVENYRRYRVQRPDVAAAWEEKKQQLTDRLGVAFVGCMVAGLEKMQALIAGAKIEPGALREVAGAVKVLGELHTVREMLIGGEQLGAIRADPTPPTSSSEPSGGAPRAGAGDGAAGPADTGDGAPVH